MGSIYGHKIVTDGLIQFLDVGNPKSFRGEPTVNLAQDCPLAESTTMLMTEASNFRPTNSQAHSSIAQSYDIKAPFPNTTVWKISNSNPDNYSRFGIGQTGVKIRVDDFGSYDKTYTASIYLYIPSSTILGGSTNSWVAQNSTGVDWHTGTYILTPHPDYGYYGDSITDSYVAYNNNLRDQWQRISITFTTSSTIKDYGGTDNCPYVTIQFRPSLTGIANLHYLYVSSLQIEEKSYTTPFVLGTRGATFATGGGLVDLSGNEKHLTLDQAPLFHASPDRITLNGTNQGFSYIGSITDSILCTVVIFYKTTDGTELWVMGNQITSHYLSASSGNAYYHNNCGTPVNYVDLNTVTNPVTEGYRDGDFHMFEAKGVDFSTWTYFNWFDYASSGWYLAGDVSIIMVYDRNLTTAESLQNYNALKNRFDI